MVVTETITKDGKEYLHNYSDAGYFIERDEVLYADAIDPIDSGRVYTETDIPIDPDSGEEDEAAYAEAGKIMMGVIE